jgi:hypothetical protein
MLSITTLVDPVVYNRIPEVRSSVYNRLKEQLLNTNIYDNEFDWDTEQLSVEFINGNTNKKCDDRLQITLSVQYKKKL